MRRASALATWVHRRWYWVLGALLLSLGGFIVGGGYWLRAHGVEAVNTAPGKAEAELSLLAGRELPADRPELPVTFAQGCLTDECHGSLKRAKHIHPTSASGRCDLCHAADAGDHTFAVAQDCSPRCLDCHEVGADKPYQHSLLSGAGCTGCHDPHASPSAFLLRKEGVAETCEVCHARAQGLMMHEPYGEGHCTTCHDPHASDFPGLMRDGTSLDNCRTCHAELVATFESVQRSHLKIENTCLACHDGHASDYPGHLVGQAAELCLSCHEDIKQSIDTAIVAHDAVLSGERCLACHDPHASDRPMMLRDGQGQVCLECHAKSLVANDGRTIPEMTSELTGRTFSHGPVKAGHCTACHSVHGARQARLLKKASPVIPIGDFDIENYALCFTCHSPALALEQTTETATRFRDGDVNLHYLHIHAGDRGRTCTSCHAVHGSNQPRDIAPLVRFEGSDWLMPIDFELTANGGSCASGCHARLGYSRSKRIQGPAAVGEGGG